MEPLIPKHGGYRKLKSFQIAQLCYDVTVRFCDRYISPRSRTHDQMVQAARSGVQNIAEGSMASGTSKKMELKLTNVARASLEELRLDYEDFLRQRSLPLWPKADPRRKALVARLNQEGRDIGLDTLLVLSHLREHPYMNADEAAQLLRVDIDEARRLLDELGPSGSGLLERKSHTRSATFHLTKGIARELLGKAAYTRTRGLNPVRYAEMVREYLHDHRSISNREVRELLGLGESPTAQVEASRYLKKWSGSSGFLTAEGNGAKRSYRLKEAS